MTTPPMYRLFKAALTPGFALAIFSLAAAPTLAQPIGSGSGSGTGTGMSAGGRNATGTGTESGGVRTLPGANNYIGPSGPRGHLISPGRIPSGNSIPSGPGIDTTFPGEVNPLPLGTMLGIEISGNAADYTAVSEIQLRFARAIQSPGDRSLSLSRIASAATFSNQLEMADKALTDASAAALQIPRGLVHDQRLISIINAMLYLSEAHLREGRSESELRDPDTTPKVDRVVLITRSRNDGRRAADLAAGIGNDTYRSEMMYKAAESLADNSQQIINDYPKADPAVRRDASGLNQSFNGLPDQMLQEAAGIATRIDRPVWHDRGLVKVASAAAESKQFARAVSIARMIPQPEVRTDALLKIADLQARRGDPTGATATFQEAARAVASIPLDDPRAVLAGVLIDNLIAVGRFEDARASVGLYPDEPRKFIALGSIAESQGRRGAARSAVAWIDSDIPPQYRSQLYRRVSNGVVAAIEQNRSRDLTNRNDR